MRFFCINGVLQSANYFCFEGENGFINGEERQQVIGEPFPPMPEGHIINTQNSRPKATIGEVNGIIFVVYTEWEIQEDFAIRIISARPATKDESEAYLKWKYI